MTHTTPLIPGPFLNPGPLADGELHLICTEYVPEDRARNLAPFYHFEMHVRGNIAGHINLRFGDYAHLSSYVGHIGYGVEPPYRGHHYAERAARLLLPLARQHGLTQVCITANPDNLPSRRTCQRLGARLIDIIPVPVDTEMYRRGDREKCRYLLDLPPAPDTQPSCTI